MASDYPLARPLLLQLAGRALLAVAVVVVVLTLLGAAAGWPWQLPVLVGVLGGVVVAGRAVLMRRGWVLRLDDEGYAVRGLRGVGVTEARWTQVRDALAAAPGGSPALVLHLADGRSTVLPMAAIRADRDAVATDVRRRLRNAHTPPVGDGAGDSAATDDSL